MLRNFSRVCFPPICRLGRSRRAQFYNCGLSSVAVLSIVLAGCSPESETGQPGATIQFSEERFTLSSASDIGPVKSALQSVNRTNKTAFLPKKDMRAPVPNSGIKTSKTTPQEAAIVQPVPASVDGNAVGQLLQEAKAPNLLKGALTPQTPVARPQSQPQSLAGFFSALAELETGKRKRPVTILHLGDEHVAYDRFANEIRKRLQNRFGDAGRGMVMPGFPFPFYRAQGLHFSKSGVWFASTRAQETANQHFGLSGVALTSRTAQAKLVVKSEKPFDWAEVSFLADAGQGNVIVSLDGGAGTVRELVSPVADGPALKTVRLNGKGNRLTIQTDGSGPVTILSLAVGKEQPGIRYVNLGLPGGSLRSLVKTNSGLAATELARIKPDLIVLSYGSKEGFNAQLDPENFENRVRALLAGFRTLSPQSSFLVLGPPDASQLPKFAQSRKADTACRPLTAAERENYSALVNKNDGRLARWHPPLSMRTVRQVMEKAAIEEGAYFWDWAKAMGGPCSIHAWVHRKPALANPDHVRLTDAGAQKSASRLFDTIMSVYGVHQRKVAALVVPERQEKSKKQAVKPKKIKKKKSAKKKRPTKKSARK